MSPRINHIPLSGGDRKAQAKGIRYAHGIDEFYFRQSVLIRSAAEAKIREADRLECEAWNAIMWARSGHAVAWRPPGRADDRQSHQRRMRSPGSQMQSLRPGFAGAAAIPAATAGHASVEAGGGAVL